MENVECLAGIDDDADGHKGLLRSRDWMSSELNMTNAPKPGFQLSMNHNTPAVEAESRREELDRDRRRYVHLRSQDLLRFVAE